jgi:hypothetical protein
MSMAHGMLCNPRFLKKTSTIGAFINRSEIMSKIVERYFSVEKNALGFGQQAFQRR